ncbi:MAG: DUF2059 domain-containing protein [Paracoccaceae bacterium]
MRLVLPALLSVCLALPVWADADSDKALIANTLFSDSTLDAVFQTMLPVMSDAVQTQFRNAGVTVSEPEAFMQIFLAEFRERYTEIMREELKTTLGDIFSDQELADIAVFIHTPSGARFFAAQGELTQAGFRLGQTAGARAGQEASTRIAERLDEEGIFFTDKSGNKVDTLKYLRGY